MRIHSKDYSKQYDMFPKRNPWLRPLLVVITALVFIGIAAVASAQITTTGRGIICNTPEQVEQVVKHRSDDVALMKAIELVNEKSDAETACAMVEAVYVRGKNVNEYDTRFGHVEIARILVMAINDGKTTHPIKPTVQYTVYLTDKAVPA